MPCVAAVEAASRVRAAEAVAGARGAVALPRMCSRAVPVVRVESTEGCKREGCVPWVAAAEV